MDESGTGSKPPSPEKLQGGSNPERRLPEFVFEQQRTIAFNSKFLRPGDLVDYPNPSIPLLGRDLHPTHLAPAGVDPLSVPLALLQDAKPVAASDPGLHQALREEVLQRDLRLSTAP